MMHLMPWPDLDAFECIHSRAQVVLFSPYSVLGSEGLD